TWRWCRHAALPAPRRRSRRPAARAGMRAQSDAFTLYYLLIPACDCLAVTISAPRAPRQERPRRALPAASVAAEPLVVNLVVGAVCLDLGQCPVDVAQQIGAALAEGDAVVLHRERRADDLEHTRIGLSLFEGHQLVRDGRVGPAEAQRQERRGHRRVVVNTGHTLDALRGELARGADLHRDDLAGQIRRLPDAVVIGPYHDHLSRGEVRVREVD